MQEPNPNKFSDPDKYITALKEYWRKYGGPSNQSRAITIRLQMWFNKEHARKKELARNVRNLRTDFKQYTSGIFPHTNSNNNNFRNNLSNSSVNGRIPQKRERTEIQKILRNLSKTSNKHADVSNKLRNIANKLTSKLPYTHLSYEHVRNKKIPKTKATIRVQNSTRTFEQLRNKLGTKLPTNLVSKILSNVIPSAELTKIRKKVTGYWGAKTNLNIYQNKNNRFWFQNKHGRWYLMTDPTQQWNYNNTTRSWRPS
jgi:hypothetical protein